MAAHRKSKVCGATRYEILLLLALDVAVAALVTLIAFALRFDGEVPSVYARTMAPTALAAGVLFPALFAPFGLYRQLWRYAGLEALFRLAAVTAAGSVLMLLADAALAPSLGRPVPVSVIVLVGIGCFIGFAAVRGLDRATQYMRLRRPSGDRRRVLIAGAGDAGALLLRDIENHPQGGPEVVAFVDDDPRKHGRCLRGVPVAGGAEDMAAIAAETGAREVLVAMPSASSDGLSRVLRECGLAGLEARVIPQLASKQVRVGLDDLREVDVDRFIGRPSNRTAGDAARRAIEGRRVLVTGAAGSIGSELCRQIAEMEPASLVMVEIDESRLYETALQIEERSPGRAQGVLCDVRDGRKVRRLFERVRPQVVVHAAAYKHVPMMEVEPEEAVKANIGGTMNVLAASRGVGVERFVLISTDKAVLPTTVMGLTKSLAERLAFSAGRAGLTVAAVRFGNVIGSRGSVLPLFRQRLERGEPVEVTHPDVDRYFMTIPEAAHLVLEAQALAEGADLFVLDMGEPVRILDLAQALIQGEPGGASVRFSGLRPAEKMHEVLVENDVGLMETSSDGVRRAGCLPLVRNEEIAAMRALVSAAQRQPEEVPTRLEPFFAAAGGARGGVEEPVGAGVV